MCFSNLQFVHIIRGSHVQHRYQIFLRFRVITCNSRIYLSDLVVHWLLRTLPETKLLWFDAQRLENQFLTIRWFIFMFRKEIKLLSSS